MQIRPPFDKAAMAGRLPKMFSQAAAIGRLVRTALILAGLGTILAVDAAPSQARPDPVMIVLLGDSLVAGYGLAPGEAFPAQMQGTLRKQGFDAELINAGVSGDTTAGGLARLEWSVPPDADGVIIALGANDALRGVDPASTGANLDAMITRLRNRGQAVLLVGMLAPPNLGEDYAARYNPIFARLAAKHGIGLYPFFLEGVAARPEFNQDDGIHPNARGVEKMVSAMLPALSEFVRKIQTERSTD